MIWLYLWYWSKVWTFCSPTFLKPSWTQISHSTSAEVNAKDLVAGGALWELVRISRECSREDIRNLAQRTLNASGTFQSELRRLHLVYWSSSIWVPRFRMQLLISYEIILKLEAKSWLTNLVVNFTHILALPPFLNQCHVFSLEMSEYRGPTSLWRVIPTDWINLLLLW